MTYSLAVRKSVDDLFSKLAKRDPTRLRGVERKMEQILADPHHFKPLKAPLQHLMRVRLAGSYVLVYSIDEKNRLIIIEDYAHHDEIYRHR